MDAFQSFLDMGSYGSYVWPSYGLTAVIMAWLVVATLRKLRAREQELARRQGELPDRRRDGPKPDRTGDPAGT